MIQYADGESFVMPYTDELRDSVISTIREVGGCVRDGEMPSVNKEGWRCARCGWKEGCVG